MKVIKVKNYEELSRTAATIIAGVILSKPDCILGLATGSSPVGTYDQLAAMYEEGILDFSLIGILSEISGIFADHKIGICAISTFNTDYIMTKQENYERALKLLQDAGYKIV